MVEKNEYFLDVCSECNRIQLDKEHSFWLDREDNPKEYDALMKDYKGRVVYGFCPEDAEKWKRVYNI